MTLDPKALRIFVRVSDHGSLSQAAKILDMAQPALSHHIGNLERELGVPLFSRKARGMALTEAGHALMPYAVSALRLLDEAQAELSRQSDTVAGTVRIGFSGSAGMLMIPRLLTAAHERYPEVRLQIVENYSATLREWVKTDRVDMAVSVAQEVTGGPGRETVPLVEEPLYLVGTPATLPKGPKTIPFAGILAHPLVLTAPGNSMRMALDRIALDRGIEIKPLAEVNGPAALKAAVLSGIGNTVLSACAVVDECRRGVLAARRIVEPGIKRTIVLDSHKRNPVRRAEAAVRDLVVELVCGLVEDGTITGKVLPRA